MIYQSNTYPKNLPQYIWSEVVKDSQTYCNEKEELLVIFYPKLDRAYIESAGRNYWLEACGINHALEQYYWINKHEIKI